MRSARREQIHLRDDESPSSLHFTGAMSLDQLFQDHHTDLLRYLTRFTGDPDEAADALQDAYLRFTQRPPPHGRELRAWLYTVATNVVRDKWRRDRHGLRLVETPERALLPDPPPDPLVETERAERRAAVQAVLTRLTDKERTVLLMREEGFAHREIATAVGTTTKSIGTMIARALRKLAEQLPPELRAES